MLILVILHDTDSNDSELDTDNAYVSSCIKLCPYNVIVILQMLMHYCFQECCVEHDMYPLKFTLWTTIKQDSWF